MVGLKAGSSSRLAPVALFVFRREESALQVLDALEQCAGFAESDVVIYADAARNADEAGEVERIRARIRQRLRPNMRLVERSVNVGLARSIICAVDELCAQYGRVIVLEDDLVPAPAFLSWMNAALDRFADTPRVMQVGGHMFDVKAVRRAGRGVFFRHPTSKGWGVWQRSWAQFDPDCTGWREQLADPVFRKRLRVHGAMRYEQMLRMQMTGRLNSWAIRFHYSVVRADGLCLYPPMSLVRDVGRQAGKATHGQRSAFLLPPAPVWPGDEPPPLPSTVEPDDDLVRAWANRLRLSPYGAAVLAAQCRDVLLRRIS